MRKKLLIPVMALVAVCLVFLSACGGPSVEDLIREDLTTQFEQVKAGDDELLAQVEASAGESFEELGVDSDEFTTSYLEGFDYEINDITVEEDTAVANVTVSCKSMMDIMNDFQTQLTDYVSTLDPSSISQESLYQAAGEILMQCVEDAEVKSTECDFTYERDSEGTWSATAEASSELTNALMS